MYEKEMPQFKCGYMINDNENDTKIEKQITYIRYKKCVSVL